MCKERNETNYVQPDFADVWVNQRKYKHAERLCKKGIALTKFIKL